MSEMPIPVKSLISVGMSPTTTCMGEVYKVNLLFVAQGMARERETLTWLSPAGFLETLQVKESYRTCHLKDTAFKTSFPTLQWGSVALWSGERHTRLTRERSGLRASFAQGLHHKQVTYTLWVLSLIDLWLIDLDVFIETLVCAICPVYKIMI